MCTLCCKEYTWQWIKIWISIVFGLFDLVVDAIYYGQLDPVAQSSGAGKTWLAILIISSMMFIAFIATRVVCIRRVLRRPDDFDHSVPTEKNLRLDTTVLMFDIAFLLVEDIPQFILLLVIQSNGWTTSAVFAMLSIMLSIILICFTGFYLLCCCGSRSTLMRMRTCVVCCDCLGCGYTAKYDAMRVRLEAAKAKGQVAIEIMDAAGINVPDGVREVVQHLNRDSATVNLESQPNPQTYPQPQTVHVAPTEQHRVAISPNAPGIYGQPQPQPQAVHYVHQPTTTVTYTAYPQQTVVYPPPGQTIYVQQPAYPPQQQQPSPYY